MKNLFSFLLHCLLSLFIIHGGQLVLAQSTPQGTSVFQILPGSKIFKSATDIIHFQPPNYVGAPWNFAMSDLYDSGQFQKSAAFWVRHNMTTPPATDTVIVRAASSISKAPVIATDAHFVVYLGPSGSNTIIKLTYLINANTVLTKTQTSAITLKPYTWYGVFISRYSYDQEKGILFVYDPSTVASGAYNQDLQTLVTAAPAGYVATGAQPKFYIDIGGDSQISQPGNCEIANFNFLYKHSYVSTLSIILELIKQPPTRILWLRYQEVDDTIQTLVDSSAANNIVIRGSSQFDTNSDTQFNYDQTVNGEVGHIYSQNSFDTIYPAFDLGREFTVAFWIQFSSRPSSVSVDSLQPVFYCQNSLYPDMKLYIAFVATATTITGMTIQSGVATYTTTFSTAMARDNADWHYFNVYFGNFYKNASQSGTFTPTTRYTITYSLTGGTIATVVDGILNDNYIYGGTTDVMTIGVGVAANNEYLYGVIKDFQVFTGGWTLQIGSGTCNVAVGADSVIHITNGQTSTKILCSHCSSTNNLYSDDCLTACPIQTYQVTNTDFLHCEPCYENCNTCTGSKPSQGTACAIGNWDPFGPISCPEKNPCTSEEYSDASSVCQECMDQCATCKDGTHCTSCTAGYSYNKATFQCGVATCGDGIVVAGEQCDDGNQVSGDGCSVSCTIEQGFYCSQTGGGCYSLCGDNVVASSEQCDDGNNNNGDGCSFNCTLEAGYFCRPTDPAHIGPLSEALYKPICALCGNALCQTCSSQSACATCVSGNYLYASSCVASCSSITGYYTDAPSQSCLACPSLCSACTNTSYCTSCTSTNALYNSQCLSTCPNGMYNGIVSGVHQCVTCPAGCQTCSSATNCYTCNNGYYLPSTGTIVCSSCDSTCLTCRGPNPTDCVLCPPGLTMQPSTSKCVSLSCASYQYANYTAGQCQDCDLTCATCSGILSTNCLTCPYKSGLTIYSQCFDCTATTGLLMVKNTCTDVCGDGRRILKSTGCDDGNLINGDGCSSTCTVESGWSCSGGTPTSPDVCVALVGPQAIVTTNVDDPTSFTISFNKKVINTLQTNELQTQISISLVGVPTANQLYNIVWNPTTQVFTINFVLLQSILGNTMLDVVFLSPNRILDAYGNSIANPETKLDYPNYYYIDPDTRKTADRLYTFSIVVQSINTVTMLPLALTGYLNHYWIFLEYFQIIHDLKFINVSTPYIADKFFDSFKYMQLSWLPNAPKYADPNFTPSRNLQQSITEIEQDTHFLINNGYQLTVWAFLIVLWVFLRIIILIGLRNSLLKNLLYFAVINLEWTFLLRAVIEMYFDFCLYTFLQLSYMTYGPGILAFNNALTIISIFFIIGFPIFCLIKTIKVKNQYQLDKDTRYDTLYREFRKRHTYTVLFMTVILLHKLLFTIFLIALIKSAEAQVAMLLILQLVMLLLLLVVRPYFDGSMNFRAIIQEFILFAVIALFFGLFKENYDESVRNNVGKVIVALLIIALLMHCAFLLHDAYLTIKNHYITKRENPRRQIFGGTRIQPGANADDFHLQPSSVFGSSGGFELARRSGNAFSSRDVEQTQGDLLPKVGIIPEQLKQHDEDESLFKDNVAVRMHDLRPKSGDQKEEDGLMSDE